MPGPKASGNKRVNVLMSEALKKRCETAAARECRSFSHWMREAAQEKLDYERGIRRQSGVRQQRRRK